MSFFTTRDKSFSLFGGNIVTIFVGATLGGGGATRGAPFIPVRGRS